MKSYNWQGVEISFIQDVKDIVVGITAMFVFSLPFAILYFLYEAYR